MNQDQEIDTEFEFDVTDELVPEYSVVNNNSSFLTYLKDSYEISEQDMEALSAMLKKQ